MTITTIGIFIGIFLGFILQCKPKQQSNSVPSYSYSVIDDELIKNALDIVKSCGFNIRTAKPVVTKYARSTNDIKTIVKNSVKELANVSRNNWSG